jgi:hypothetical protein
MFLERIGFGGLNFWGSFCGFIGTGWNFLINRFLACLAAFLAMFAVSALFIGLNRNERDKVVELARRKLLRFSR